MLDLVLPNRDGYAVLEDITKLNPTPKVVVTTALSSSNFVHRAMQLGASYFMIKPINAENLVARINEVSSLLPVENKQLDEKISNIFISIGIPAHIKGYQFLREAVKLAVEEPEIISSITKKLYPTIA